MTASASAPRHAPIHLAQADVPEGGRSITHERGPHPARRHDRRRDRVCDPRRPVGDAGDDGGHDPARASVLAGPRRRLADAPRLRARRVADLRAPGRAVPRVLEPDGRLPRRWGRGARPAYGQGFARGGERPARPAGGAGARSAGRPRLRLGRRGARGRDRAAAHRARSDDRVRRVAHGRRPRRTDHRGAGASAYFLRIGVTYRIEPSARSFAVAWQRSTAGAVSGTCAAEMARGLAGC